MKPLKIALLALVLASQVMYIWSIGERRKHRQRVLQMIQQCDEMTAQLNKANAAAEKEIKENEALARHLKEVGDLSAGDVPTGYYSER